MQRRIATTAGRHGFTMIELMIVIAVIGLLMTLVTVGAMRFLGTAKEAATKATLTKIHRQLQSRIQAIERMDLEEFFRLTNQDSTYSQALNDAGFTTIMGTASSSPRAALIGKVILKKSVFKLYLPQTWAEAFDR